MEESKPKALAVPVSQALPSRVAVVGSGNFGRAIVTKVRSAGFDVIWGSRNPVGDQVPVEKVMMESLLILAVPSFSWSSLPLSSLCPGCVVLDPSNRRARCEPGSVSQAESLQQLLPPGVTVVKCLNTLSAYELENMSFAAGKQVETEKHPPISMARRFDSRTRSLIFESPQNLLDQKMLMH